MRATRVFLLAFAVSLASTGLVSLLCIQNIEAGGAGASVYWGAYVHSQAPSNDAFLPTGKFSTFEQLTGKKMAIIHWGQPWVMPDGSWGEFQQTYFENVRKHGSIPMLNWSSLHLGAGIDQPDFQLADIYGGRYDAYITRWATAAKSWGHPFFLRFDHEMNGNWYPWAEGRTSAGTIVNGNYPGDYVKAWRHVRDIFRTVGATNATWIWCPNIVGDNMPQLAGLYPGDAYVDWVAMDGYNFGTDRGNQWTGFYTVFKNTYDQLTQLAPAKPVMIAEFASSEDGGPLGRPGSKAAWIKDAFQTQLPKNFPRIKAVVWFNWNDRDPLLDWPIESSQSSIDAFSGSIGGCNYATNSFADINVSPIPPLDQLHTTCRLWVPFLHK